MKKPSKNENTNYTIERTNHRERFEIITNYHLLDNRLSLAEKGFLTLLYILPNKWKITQRATANYFNISTKSFNTYIKKLVELGYIEIKKTTKNKATYIIKEQSTKAQFDIKNIANYTLKQLRTFLNDARVEQKYKNLIKQLIETATQTEEHFNKTLAEIEKMQAEQDKENKPLPFE